jgi:hypothetical protein
VIILKGHCNNIFSSWIFFSWFSGPILLHMPSFPFSKPYRNCEELLKVIFCRWQHKILAFKLIFPRRRGLQAVDLSTVIYVNDGDKWIVDVVDTVFVPGVNNTTEKTKLRNILVSWSQKNPIGTEEKWEKNLMICTCEPVLFKNCFYKTQRQGFVSFVIS